MCESDEWQYEMNAAQREKEKKNSHLSNFYLLVLRLCIENGTNFFSLSLSFRFVCDVFFARWFFDWLIFMRWFMQSGKGMKDYSHCNSIDIVLRY